MNPELQKQIFDRLDSIGQKLSVGAQALWKMYVFQARLDGIEYLAFAILSTVVGICAAHFARKNFAGPSNAYLHNDPEEADREGLGFVMTLVVIGSATAAGFCWVQAIDHLLNPQLAAFQSIIESLRNQ